MMNKKSSNCAICENSNLASICVVCVNYRLNDYNNSLKALKSHRDSLYSRLSDALVAKGKAGDQQNWRVLQNEKLVKLREKLRFNKEQLVQGFERAPRNYYSQQFFPVLLECAIKAIKAATDKESEVPHLSCMAVVTLEGLFHRLIYFSQKMGVNWLIIRLLYRDTLKETLELLVIGPGNVWLNASYKTADEYAFQDALGKSL